MRERGPIRAAALACVALAAVAGCSNSGGQAAASSSRATDSAAPAVSGTVTVMAPAPLKGALDRAKTAFEGTHAGLTVTVNYGHIPALLSQLSQGVPGDVLVTPDEVTMNQAQAKGVTAPTTVAVARNRLALVVPAANPAQVKDVSALGDAKLTIAACAAELPCGKLATQLVTKAGIALAADSLEPGGSPAIVTKAAAGEIDLGLSFAADVKAGAEKVTAIPIADDLGVSAQVTEAVLKAPHNPDAAAAFVAFLSSTEGKTLFTEAGFAAL